MWADQGMSDPHIKKLILKTEIMIAHIYNTKQKTEYIDKDQKFKLIDKTLLYTEEISKNMLMYNHVYLVQVLDTGELLEYDDNEWYALMQSSVCTNE